MYNYRWGDELQSATCVTWVHPLANTSPKGRSHGLLLILGARMQFQSPKRTQHRNGILSGLSSPTPGVLNGVQS